MPAPFDLESFLPYRLNRAAELISLSFSKEYKQRFQMTRPEWRALAALGSVGRMTATDIGVHSNMHKTKVSRAVHALEERRWLKRSENVADRRVEHLELTAQGQKAYREVADLARTYQSTLEKALGSGAIERIEAGLADVEQALLARPRKRV
ncbi:MarR family winged helix-turn-helix transcriptional regulator [Aminobacter anthyllidis]|uniref:MarR family winged helix-turn-helix transcriptional regulator n=1 Tax=Aminobacter anthyllidis TaxID=1035067 RepID=UPI002453C69B|nr:MarR family winged helix-turn-helix transcriptional regulator [Aminobacter anthyllidis]MDH4984402.1 MarR family winged helix-turn-helix transcriptional regulator [Aminobacter anthyllidis]